jgi:YfiH family protein
MQLIRVQHPEGPVTYRSPQLAALGVSHGFTTRVGGVSGPPRDSLDLGPVDSSECAENLRRVQAALGLEKRRAVMANQVHGCGVCVAGALPDGPLTGDALVTDDEDALLVIRVADCVPILIADGAGRVVAAVHAGWRGVVAGVVTRTVEEMRGRFGVEPAGLTAAIGPCIGRLKFEVGAEVAEAFYRRGLAAAVSERAPGIYIDLSLAVRMQLEGAGLRTDQIDTTERCTYSDAAEFFSYRRDAGKTGRLGAVIGAKAARPA